MEQEIKFTRLSQPLNKYTFKAPKTKQWVEDHCKGLSVLNLFAGPTKLEGCIEEIRNDLDESINADYHMDALQCVNLFKDRDIRFDVVLLDPPYAYRKSMECYNGNSIASRFKRVLDVIPDILNLNGKVITFGYHSAAMSKKRGFKIVEICLIYHGGAQHDSIATVEERIII